MRATTGKEETAGMSEFERMECEATGIVMDAFVAQPEGSGPFPTVLMFPGATGTGPTFEATACELACLGYLAIGINVYGVDADISTPESSGQLFVALLEAPDTLRARVGAWRDVVAARSDVDESRMAAIGYCFGGKCVLELARSGADLQAVVSYHGLLSTHAPAAPGSIKPMVVAYCAGQDPYAPVDQFDAFCQEMRQCGAKHQVTFFSEAQHSFTDPDHDGLMEGIAYDPLSHKVSWAGTLALLTQMLR